MELSKVVEKWSNISLFTGNMMTQSFLDELRQLCLASDVMFDGQGYSSYFFNDDDDLFIPHTLYNMAKALNPLQLPWKFIVGGFVSPTVTCFFEEFSNNARSLMNPEEKFIAQYWDIRSMMHVYFRMVPGCMRLKILKKALGKALEADVHFWKEMPSLPLSTERMKICYSEMVAVVFLLKERICRSLFSCSLSFSCCKRKKQLSSELGCKFFSHLSSEYPWLDLNHLSPMMMTTLQTVNIPTILRSIKHRIGFKDATPESLEDFRTWRFFLLVPRIQR